MTSSRSQLLRTVLGELDAAPPAWWDRSATYVWFPTEDAIKIRIALGKGAQQPLCPRCGTALCTHPHPNTRPSGTPAALVCQPCRHVIVARLGTSGYPDTTP